MHQLKIMLKDIFWYFKNLKRHIILIFSHGRKLISHHVIFLLTKLVLNHGSIPASLLSPPPVLRQARSFDPHAAPSPSFTFPLLSSSISPFSPSFFCPSPFSPEAPGCGQDAFLAAALGGNKEGSSCCTLKTRNHARFHLSKLATIENVLFSIRRGLRLNIRCHYHKVRIPA